MRLHTWFLAFFKLSKKAVCQASAERGFWDYHDHRDANSKPLEYHMHVCARCGKEFML